MNIHRTIHTVLGLALMLTLTHTARSAELSAADKQFLAGYEEIHVALANDDLAAAKKAAPHLGADGASLGKADTLEAARTDFVRLGDKAAKLATGHPGYYLVNCPMVKKDWVQTTDKVSNPYLGKSMASCGVAKPL